MVFVVQERRRDSGTWTTMRLSGDDCVMAETNAQCAACRLRRYFGEDFEYRVIRKSTAEDDG